MIRFQNVPPFWGSFSIDPWWFVGLRYWVFNCLFAFQNYHFLHHFKTFHLPLCLPVFASLAALCGLSTGFLPSSPELDNTKICSWKRWFYLFWSSSVIFRTSTSPSPAVAHSEFTVTDLAIFVPVHRPDHVVDLPKSYLAVIIDHWSIIIYDKENDGLEAAMIIFCSSICWPSQLAKRHIKNLCLGISWFKRFFGPPRGFLLCLCHPIGKMIRPAHPC